MSFTHAIEKSIRLRRNIKNWCYNDMARNPIMTCSCNIKLNYYSKCAVYISLNYLFNY